MDIFSILIVGLLILIIVILCKQRFEIEELESKNIALYKLYLQQEERLQECLKVDPNVIELKDLKTYIEEYMRYNKSNEK